ncbi:hypothetical protein [Burkholderia ubonensis]|uniref:hypothetical protein n=1 Tax=Burkholderia ubonensis TaxID=101571 RepID=UPI0007C71AB1|nr:hypothetical protein [Burkholderia ubonensis]
MRERSRHLQGLRQGLRVLAFAALAWIAVLLAAQPAFADAFDRAAEAQRYRAWLAQFEADFATLQQRSASGGPISDDEFERIFAKSVVPKSRAVPLLKTVAEHAGVSAGAGFAVAGAGRIFFDVLRESVPAGEGGIYPETDPKIAARDLTVWYMHIGTGGETAERYFSDPKRFKPYHLPPPGTLERNAYPFLLMDDRHGALRLGGVSAEFWNLIATLHGTQFQ